MAPSSESFFKRCRDLRSNHRLSVAWLEGLWSKTEMFDPKDPDTGELKLAVSTVLEEMKGSEEPLPRPVYHPLPFSIARRTETPTEVWYRQRDQIARAEANVAAGLDAGGIDKDAVRSAIAVIRSNLEHMEKLLDL